MAAPRNCDLMVLSTHHRSTLQRLMTPSVATRAADDCGVPILFLRDDCTRFIERANEASLSGSSISTITSR